MENLLNRTATHPPYLEALNPEQREAVFHTGNPLLILAGAGSGKTRVITTKIAYLIREKGVDPRSILAVTFTNRAAREMADRARLIDDRAAYTMLRTFHSFGAWFLRRNGSFAGLDSGFTIYDDEDMVSLLSLIMEKASKGEIKHIARSIARAKDYFLSPDDPHLSLIDYRKEFRRVYARYEERLAQIGNVDFGDLIKKPVEILRTQREVAGRFRDRFRVIMVDEYQDANIAQFELLKELCGPETYLCVVGDDDQSIYRFRGAEVRNILEFPDRFAGTDIIRLERNYRSIAPILNAASSVVNRNQGRLGKTLIAERGNGKKPVLAFLPNQDEEAVFCAKLIENSVHPPKGRGSEEGKKTGSRKTSYADWAVLYRTNAQSLGFETEFLRRHIPYRVVGSLKFYEREEIKDALALLSFLVNPKDEIAFRRVVNKPARGVGAATAGRIVENAAMDSQSMGNLSAAAQRLLPELSAKARSGLEAFLKAMESGRETLAPRSSKTSDGESGTETGGRAEEEKDTPKKPRRKSKKAAKTSPDQRDEGEKERETRKREGLNAGEGLSACVVRLIQNTGIAEYHLLHDEIAGNQRISNLQELANAASLYPATEAGLLEFLEHIELDRSLEYNPGGNSADLQDLVTLITLHNTKGLEFRRVIMTGIEQGVFPRDDKKGEELEEERRLFYVGATRAMDELYLCSSALRRLYGHTMPMQPSLFLYEIDKTGLRIIGTPPRGYITRESQSSRGGQKTEVPTGTWEIGNRIFHEDQGYGSVIEIRESAEGPVVQVRFDTGKELHFLGLRRNSRITKINACD
ncbi:MAG: ATP-dependent helicase [Treponema sp.]|jgi:DNA helicase-2/ATP-dependent DNA helicase PcrA|nr:ATP-dependent helicase [Treponema sp.]